MSGFVPCAGKQRRCHTAGSATLVGLGWEWKDGRWVRWLIRQCARCLTLEVQELHSIDLDYAICLGCFSQDARIETKGNEVGLVCNVCNRPIEYVVESDSGWIEETAP